MTQPSMEASQNNERFSINLAFCGAVGLYGYFCTLSDPIGMIHFRRDAMPDSTDDVKGFRKQRAKSSSRKFARLCDCASTPLNATAARLDGNSTRWGRKKSTLIFLCIYRQEEQISPDLQNRAPVSFNLSYDFWS